MDSTESQVADPRAGNGVARGLGEKKSGNGGRHWGKDFRNGRLSDLDCRLSENLAGANLSGAELPEKYSFPHLDVARAECDAVAKAWLANVAVVAYTGLILLKTTDSVLLSNENPIKMPLLDVDLPPFWLFTAAPLVLAGLLFYVGYRVQRAWNSLCKLPAIFPDGISILEKCECWLLSGYLKRENSLLRSTRGRGLLQIAFAIAAMLPNLAVIFCFWSRSLRIRSELTTLLQLVVLGWAVFETLFFFPTYLSRSWKKALAALVVLLLCAFVSRDCFYTNWSPTIGVARPTPADASMQFGPRFIQALGTRNYYNVCYQAISRGASFHDGGVANLGLEATLKNIEGIDLTYKSLQFLAASSAQFAKCRFSGSDLRGAIFDHADLRECDFTEAGIVDTNFSGALLSRTRFGDSVIVDADFDSAKLDGADFSKAQIYSANFSKANLHGANFSGVILMTVDNSIKIAGTVHAHPREVQPVKDSAPGSLPPAFGIDFTEADLAEAVLCGADFTVATGITRDQWNLVKKDDKTKAPAQFADPRFVFGAKSTEAVSRGPKEKPVCGGAVTL